MPEDASNTSENEDQPNEHGRGHHEPQHASAKHVRPTVEKSDDGDAEEVSDEGSSDSSAPAPVSAGGPGPHHKVWHWIKSHKKVSIPVAALLLLAVLAAIPFTRYALAGTVVRKNYAVLVTDSQTNKPVTRASVTLEGKVVITNNKGEATIRVNVGHAKLAVSKKYYTGASKNVLVPIGKQKQPEKIRLAATGRQVPVVVTNKISGKPAVDVTIATGDTEAKTDAKGEVVMVLPADKLMVEATIKGTGYNTAKVTVKVTPSADPANTFQVTPSGKLYFLSNLSGNIDVVKTNLDGTNRQTVLAGTGREDNNTVLLASQDWQYLALLSKRDGGDNPKLFLISTSGDSLITMDEGDASFNIVGWSGHKFVYNVVRNAIQTWQPNRQALKSYDADANKNNTLDQTAAAGTTSQYFYESFGTTYIYSNEIVYSKNVTASTSNDVNGHEASLNSVKPDGSSKHAVKGWTFSSLFTYYSSIYLNVNTRPYAPNDIYAAVSMSPAPASPDNNLYQYEDGQITTVSGKTAGDLYNGDYATYLLSPSDKQTFWSEPRDGKNTLFVGDAAGQGGKIVASLSDYQTYGWYTEKYVLMSKNGSELYIMPAAGGTPLKITDYYKPNVSFTGYGKGYGGL
jgi:hypothetical protein